RAEFAMHEEFDWLVGLILSDPPRRRDSAQALHDITAAIRSRDPQLAHAVAGRHVATVIEQLARLRLELMAAQHRAGGEAGQQAFAAAIRSFAEQIIEWLHQLGHDTAGPFAAGEGPAVIQQHVSRSLFTRLDETGPAIHGLGVLAEVGVIPGHDYWMDWWLRTDAGGLQPDTHHVMDPSRDNFYDYASRDFIAGPRKHRIPWATGPYIDHGGVDDYLVTMSVPIIGQGRFLGVAAADLLVADIERVFAPWLASANGVRLLLNADGRVIVSNTATYNVGDVAWTGDLLHRTDLGIFGWSLAANDLPAAELPAAQYRIGQRNGVGSAEDHPS
ncbi:MAG: PDC sensor domain-containing protein, partial [Actinobacteria bacterium]|nr:PDC sensor domain-containing protein [Actinomycetota bacterium]